MARFPYQYVNINGIPSIKTQAIVVSDTSVVYKFAPDFDRRPFRGLILVYISEPIPEGTTTTLPVTLTMNGTTRSLTLPNGTPATAMVQVRWQLKARRLIRLAIPSRTLMHPLNIYAV